MYPTNNTKLYNMKSLFRTVIFVIGFILSFNANGQDINTRGTIQETGGNIVVLLETANWGQNSPFNNQCWTSYGSTTHAKTGCVPTAYAIVMRYHKFPKQGTSKILYNSQAPTYVEVTDREYDWDSMPLTYDGNWSEKEIYEVSKIMSHIGFACNATYGANSTNANEEQNSDKLNKFFNYQLIYASYQADFTQEAWEAKIRESLDNGCPIPYAANNSGTGDSRHMFVIDGYTDNGYFHFNFGWNGSGNGWFKLNNITPYQGDNYSWNGTSRHYAIFNLMPNMPKYAVTATAADKEAGSVSINNGTAGNSATADIFEGATATLTATANEGYSFLNWTKNGEIVGENRTLNVTVSATDNAYVANFVVATAAKLSYTVSPATGTLNNGTSKSNTWTFTTTDESPISLTLKTTSGETAVNAMSVSSGKFKYYANAYDDTANGYNNIKYTLSVPEGYIITGYNLTYWVSNSNKGEVTVSNMTTTETPEDTKDHYLTASPNKQTTEFNLSVSESGQQFITIEDFTVTIQKEGSDETAIEAIETVANNEIYNINGQRIDRITKPGLYIINGKKVLKR